MKVETSYGIVRRLQFITDTLRFVQPARVLDMGCGTGAQLTYNLARALPESRFVGVDENKPSILFASERFSIANLEFHTTESLRTLGIFDVVILSEVLEHAAQPHRLLSDVNSLLRPDGLLILTVPNGYGPFEIASFLHSIKKLLFGPRAIPESAITSMFENGPDPDTLGQSPHINFFTIRSLSQLLDVSGFLIERHAGRSFLCGWILDSVVRRLHAESWNAKIAETLPLWMCSGWMFTVKKVGDPDEYRIKHQFATSFRGWINRKSSQCC